MISCSNAYFYSFDLLFIAHSSELSSPFLILSNSSKQSKFSVQFCAKISWAIFVILTFRMENISIFVPSWFFRELLQFTLNTKKNKNKNIWNEIDEWFWTLAIFEFNISISHFNTHSDSNKLSSFWVEGIHKKQRTYVLIYSWYIQCQPSYLNPER